MERLTNDALFNLMCGQIEHWLNQIGAKYFLMINRQSYSIDNSFKTFTNCSHFGSNMAQCVTTLLTLSY